MIKENLNLDKVIDLKKWAKLQESLSLVTKAAIIIVDYKGNPVTKHSGCNRFCSAVRSHPELFKYCQKCDSRGGLEAVRLNEPYIYLCHYNIVDIAIPIIVDGKYIGAIMAGQIKLSDDNASDFLEQIVMMPKNYKGKNALKKFKKYYDEIPILSLKKVQQIANMLYDLCNYLVEEALNKNLISEIYQKAVTCESEIASNTLAGYTTKNIKNAKKEISNALLNSYVGENLSTDSLDTSISNTLKPAIQYIYNHKSENITAKKLADICHISPSYFSRLFSKELGKSCSSFISNLKIDWAKKLLEETDMHINEISDELGFNETGYFIKIFKKYEGVTPFVYKKYCKKF
ncbi:PocR ligand-binding domain-containing protein [Clostridium botulinum]|nr:PocR ligand-binding domain-containing protein [Clostridium botulinum]EJO5349617.1 PocR ligand-binding domain-containing protein [Clostridium botulinum]